MTNNTNENPFIFTTGTAGYERRYVDASQVAKALAAAWGASVGESEPGAHGIGRVVFESGLMVTVRDDSRKLGKIEVFAGCPKLERKLDHYSRPQFPKASADTGKGIDKLAADLMRRVVEPSALPLAQLEQRFAAQTNDRENLKAHAEALQAAIPGLRVDIPGDETRTDASVGGQIGGVYVTARLSSSGSVSIDRLTSLGASQALAVFAALAANSKEA